MWIYEAGHYSRTTGDRIVDYADACGTEDGAIYTAGCAELQISAEGHWGNQWSEWWQDREENE